MSLCDRIFGDVDRIFYRQSEFARLHDWNGHEIVCIVDDEMLLSHKNANTLSVEWDVGEADTAVRIPESQLEIIDMPVETGTVYFDEKQCRVEKVAPNEGEIIVFLRHQEARSVV